ncbi:hypothetical protein F5B21DRAFT_473389 [Xylaria acuta]|nr:hypothetical protein F5B21DRAFT_473389 [Xylaria acuta]
MISFNLMDPEIATNFELVSQGTPQALCWLPWFRAQSRAISFCITQGNHLGPVTEHRDSRDLQEYLRGLGESMRTIHILEGLAPDFTAVIGLHFCLHCPVFTDHDRLVAFPNRATGEGGGLPFFPSSIQGRHHISLKYHEAVTISPRPTRFRNLCEASGRHIMATRMSGSFSEVM